MDDDTTKPPEPDLDHSNPVASFRRRRWVLLRRTGGRRADLVPDPRHSYCVPLRNAKPRYLCLQHVGKARKHLGYKILGYIAGAGSYVDRNESLGHQARYLYQEHIG